MIQNSCLMSSHSVTVLRNYNKSFPNGYPVDLSNRIRRVAENIQDTSNAANAKNATATHPSTTLGVDIKNMQRN